VSDNEYRLVHVSMVQQYADALIESAVSCGPRADFPAMGPGQVGIKAWDPVADFRSVHPTNFCRAYTYCIAARALGIL
jgi:hypothetical protein